VETEKTVDSSAVRKIKRRPPMEKFFVPTAQCHKRETNCGNLKMGPDGRDPRAYDSQDGC